MIVIKLGGSLLTSGWLQYCLDKIEKTYQGRAVVIVPGGGGFADEVRKLQEIWHFDDRTAHHMAILAMQQIALLINGLKSSFGLFMSVCEFKKNPLAAVTVWSPDVVELDQAGIPATWSITSDSLSAWLANTLAADELIIVKSVAIDKKLSMRKLAELQIVDASLAEYIDQSKFKLTITHVNDFLS